MDDEESFKRQVLTVVENLPEVDWSKGIMVGPDYEYMIVELFTGDRFKVSIEQVRD